MVSLLPAAVDELEQRGTVRQVELLDEYHGFTRADVDDLVLEGKVERGVVGEHIMLKWTGEGA